MYCLYSEAALSIVSSPLGEVAFKESPWHKNESDPVT